jgi:hypothetical protein
MLLPAMRAANVRRLIMVCPNEWIQIADGDRSPARPVLLGMVRV